MTRTVVSADPCRMDLNFILAVSCFLQLEEVSSNAQNAVFHKFSRAPRQESNAQESSESSEETVEPTEAKVVIDDSYLDAESDESDENESEVPNGQEYLEAIFEDIKNSKAIINTMGAETTECYPEIGCFTPSSLITKKNGLQVDPPEKIQTRFLLYTREQRLEPKDLDYIDKKTLDTEVFKPDLPVVVIIHGFFESSAAPWIADMKNALLDKKDINVVVVDWGGGSKFPYYSQAIANSELVSRQVARLLTSMKMERGYDIRKTHIIGFSLGAHLAGFAGKFLHNETEFLGRITGLDPAGPKFRTGEDARLSHNDADYVDVVHTNGGKSLLSLTLGLDENIGHADFYANGGSKQPGCRFFDMRCRHKRSVRLFVESIRSNCRFESIRCETYEQFLDGKCTDDRAYLGFYSDTDPHPKGNFYLKTTGKAPYC